MAALLRGMLGGDSDKGRSCQVAGLPPVPTSRAWCGARFGAAAAKRRRHCAGACEATLRRVMRATYRRGLAPIAGSALTSDTGWGCMLRTAQSMLAHAWQRQLQGTAWAASDTAMPQVEGNIAQWVADLPLSACVYGLHAAALVAASLHGMAPGAWYGPLAIAKVLEALNALHVQRDGASMLVHVVEDGLLVADAVHALCAGAPAAAPAAAPAGAAAAPAAAPAGAAAAPAAGAGTGAPRRRWRRSVLLLVPLRLGLEGLNKECLPPLLRCLQLPSSVGLVGGTPRHSLYVVGARGPAAVLAGGAASPADWARLQVAVLDPHTTQAPPRSRSRSMRALQRKASSAPSEIAAAAATASAAGAAATSPASPPPPPDSPRRSTSARTPVGGGDGLLGAALEGRLAHYAPHLAAVRALPTWPGDAELEGAFHNSLFAPAAGVAWRAAGDLDPSLALGFHVRNEGDFQALCEGLAGVWAATGVELFSLVQEVPAYLRGDGGWDGEDGAAQAPPPGSDAVLVQEPCVTAAGLEVPQGAAAGGEEDYVVL